MNVLVRRTVKFLEFVLVAILVLLLLAVTFQKLSGNKDFFGYRIFTVATSSMVPNYNVGDTLLVKKVPIGEIKIGDAVTYKGEDKTVKDKIITHRVEKIEREGAELLFHTKGIANNIEDPIVYEHQILGKVTHKFIILSLFGKIAYNVYLLFIFITVPLAILITIEIIKVSKLSDEDEDDEPTSALPKILVEEYKTNKYGHGETPTEMLPVIEGPRCHKALEKTRAIPIVEEEPVQELEKTKVIPTLEKTRAIPVVNEKPKAKQVGVTLKDKKKVEVKRTPPRQMPNQYKKQKVNNSYKAKNKNRYVNVRTKKYRNSSEYYKKIRNNNNNNNSN